MKILEQDLCKCGIPRKETHFCAGSEASRQAAMDLGYTLDPARYFVATAFYVTGCNYETAEAIIENFARSFISGYVANFDFDYDTRLGKTRKFSTNTTHVLQGVFTVFGPSVRWVEKRISALDTKRPKQLVDVGVTNTRTNERGEFGKTPHVDKMIKKMLDCYKQFRWHARDRASGHMGYTQSWEAQYKQARRSVEAVGCNADQLIKQYGTRD